MNNFHILSKFIQSVLNVLVVLAEITQLSKLFHVFTTPLVKWYVHSYILSETGFLKSQVTYVQAWTRVGTAATSYFPVNILYVSIMTSPLIRLKCSVESLSLYGRCLELANSSLPFSVLFPILLYPLFYTEPKQNSSRPIVPSVIEPCFCTIIWKRARLNDMLLKLTQSCQT